MEVKLWVPNFLRVNPDFKITWSGPAMPPGTLLYPYQSPVLQVINLSTFENCPKNVKEALLKGSLTWVTLMESESFENATLLPIFVKGLANSISHPMTNLAFVLRKLVVEGAAVTIFSGNANTTETTEENTQRSIIPAQDLDPNSRTITSNKRARTKTMLPCRVCSKTFDRPSLLKRHHRTHTGEKPHVCDVCKKGFSTSSSLNTHRRIHSGEKPHACSLCGKRFTASSNLYYHKMTHKKDKLQNYQTKKVFSTFEDLKNHQQSQCLSNTNPFLKCHFCFKTFAKDITLKNHLLSHLKTTSPAENFHNSQDFRMANLLQMTPPKNLENNNKCPVCQFFSSDETALRWHQISGSCIKANDV